MKNFVIFGLSLSLLFYTASLYRGIKNNSDVLSIEAPPVTVSLSIGEYRFRLYGYSSPKALVTIEGNGIYDQTYARESDGYFEFTNRFSPLSPREACLTAKDQFGRLTTPVCLPPFPTQYNVDIGPVIMPPTLSLNHDYFYIGDQVILSGQAIPNTNVNLSTFIDEKKSVLNYLAKFSIIDHVIKPVEAYTFPNIPIKSDKKGNFSVSIPSNHPEFYRLFAQSIYDKELSPRSLTLNTKILPWWMIIIQFFLFLWNLIKDRFIELVVASELLFLAYYLMHMFFVPDGIARNRSLAILPVEALVLPEHELMIEPNSLPMIEEDHELLAINESLDELADSK